MYQNGKNISILDRSVRSVDTILAEISKCKPLTTEQEYKLWLSMRHGSKSAFDSLVVANMPYVMRVAKQYLPSGAATEDLFQAGCEGLIKAAHKFDASLGYHFISFATWYVENEVRKAAYNYISNNSTSLDEPINTDDAEGDTRIDRLSSYPSQSTDWNLCYLDTLNTLKARIEERQYGTGRLVVDLHQMLLDGYTTSDFARRHYLTEQQMNHLLSMLREEAGLLAAA